jgi:hypothetical protein
MKLLLTVIVLAAVAILFPVPLEAEVSDECKAGIAELESETTLQSELKRMLAGFGKVVCNTNTCNATNGLKEFDCNITFQTMCPPTKNSVQRGMASYLTILFWWIVKSFLVPLN